MDKDSQKFVTSDNRGGFPHSLRPNTLPVLDRSASYNHLLSSHYQSFEKDKLRSGTSNSTNNLGEYILGDPMLVDQSILERTYQHGRAHGRMFSPQFEGDYHRDQPPPYSPRYSDGNMSLAHNTDAKELSPAYLNISPLFPQFQPSLGSRDVMSAFDPSQMAVASSQTRSPNDSNNRFRKTNPSPLFHPSTRQVPNEIALPSPNNANFPDNIKHRDSFLGIHQQRESILRIRKPKSDHFIDLTSNSFANQHRQGMTLTPNKFEEFDQFQKAYETDKHNRNGIEALQQQLLSNLPVNASMRHHFNNVNIASELPISSANDSTNYVRPRTKMYNVPSCIPNQINPQNNGVIVIEDNESPLDDTNKQIRTSEDREAHMSKFVCNPFNTVSNAEDVRQKSRLVKHQHRDQELDDLTAKTNRQLTEADAILRSRLSNNARSVEDKRTDNENKSTLTNSMKRSNTSQFKNLRDDTVESCKESLKEDSSLDAKQINGNDDKVLLNFNAKKSGKDVANHDNSISSDLHQNRMSSQMNRTGIEQNKQTERSNSDQINHKNDKHDSPTRPVPENPSPGLVSAERVENEDMIEEVFNAKNDNSVSSDESDNMVTDKDDKKSSELTREERAIQYAMQKFQEMEERKKGKKRRKRHHQHKKEKEILENLHEAFEYDKDTLVKEKKGKKSSNLSICVKEGDRDKCITNNLPTTNPQCNETDSGQGIIPKKRRRLKKKDSHEVSKNFGTNLHLPENVDGQISKMTSLDDKDSKTQPKTDLQQKSYLLVPSYRGFKDFAPILLEGRTRQRSTKSDTEKIGKPKFPILVVEQVGEKKNEILVKENEDLDAKIAKESLLAENVYDEIDLNNHDNKAKTNVRQLTCNRMTGETVLHKAARLGYDDVVLIKIKEGADVNARDNAGWTALHEACSRGMTDVVRVLLKYGADPNSCSESGIRPIHDAVDSNNIEVIRLLLSYGADVSTETYSGLKILQLARTESTKMFLTGYAGDIQESSVPNNTEDTDFWQFRGSSYILDDPKDDSDEIISKFPEDSDRLMEFEASKVPFLPCYNLPVYNEVRNVVCYRNYYRMQDVLKTVSTSRHAFLKRHKFELREMPLAEFVQHVSKTQVSIPPEYSEIEDDTQLVELIHIGPFTSKKIFDLKAYTV